MNHLYLATILTEREEIALTRAYENELGDPIKLWVGGNEALISAVQKFLVLLGIPTTLEGDCLVDGKWGPGTSRALAFYKEAAVSLGPCDNDIEALYAPSISALKAAIRNETLAVWWLHRMETLSHEVLEKSDNPRRKLWDWWMHQKKVQLSCHEIFRNDRIPARAAQEKLMLTVAGQELPPNFYHLLLAIAKEECGGVPAPRLEQSNFVLYRPILEGFNLGRTYGLGQISGKELETLLEGSSWSKSTSDPQLQYGLIGLKLLTSEAAAAAKKSRLTFEDCTKVARYYHGAGFVASRYNHGLMQSLQEFKALEVEN